jgi:hypothetical protein
MKKFLALLLLSSLLTACSSDKKNEAPTFAAYPIADCQDYFDYLYADLDATQREGGIAEDVTCSGKIDYKSGNKFALGLYIQTKNYGEKRIGFGAKDGNNEALQKMDGQNIETTGDLLIQIPDSEGVRFIVDPEEL